MKKILIIGITTLIFTNCASSHKVKYAKHRRGKGIRQIDALIVESKQDYYKECYEPLMKDNVPENECQHRLFSTLERRYHLRMEDKYFAMAANDIFFKNVERDLKQMVRRDRDLAKKVKRRFKSHESLLAYYKAKYKFIAND